LSDVKLSIAGLLLAAAYLWVPILCAVRVVAKNSFGGLWSQEFALFVVTLPCSPIAEFLFKRHNWARLAVYALSALVNGAILYLAGWGLEALITA
jgi:hypothetical protein